MSRRTAITGIGVIAPGAGGTKRFWDLLSAGRTATRRITGFDPAPYRSQIAAECDFDPLAEGLSARQASEADRVTQFALAAAREAVESSGLSSGERVPGRTGVVLGSAVGATMSLEKEYVAVSGAGSRWLVDEKAAVPHLFNHFVPSSIAAEVAWEVGAEGPVHLVSTGCTSGIDAVG